MMKLKDVSRSQRVEAARERWQKHLVAQRASGQTQVMYCRARGLDPSYFSLWKRRLASRGRSAPAPRSRSMQLVPLVVKAAPGLAAPVASAAEAILMEVTLRNGLSVSLKIPGLSIPVLLSGLAELSC